MNGGAAARPAVWAFDVDGTLVGSIRSEVLRPGARELLQVLRARDVRCVLWSVGGKDYARRVAAQHGIDHFFDGIYAKGDRGVDGRYLVDHFAPGHVPVVFVDDSPIDLPVSARAIAVPQFIGNNPADAALADLRAKLDEHALDADPGRAAVVGRLLDLFHGWSAEPAVELATADARSWWTWGDVAAVHAALARVVAEQAVPDGAATAVVMRQRPALVAAELAVLASGRPALLVSPLAADRELAADIEHLAPAVLVAHAIDWSREGMEAAVRAAGSFGLEVADDGRVTVRVATSAVPAGPALAAAVTVLTSGTTGPAKRLPVTWETFVGLGGGPSGRPPASGRGALILSLPLVTLGGLLSMARLVFGGRPMAMLERFDVRTWASLVKEHRPAVMGAPPPVVQMILDADISPDHFDGVNAFMTSSAPIAPDVARRFESRYGIPVLLGYGATEFLNSVTGWTSSLWSTFGAAKLGSVGRAHPGVKLRVVDAATGAELAAGNEGLLEVDPPQRAGGLPEGWMRTADRAHIDADGFLWIAGRADDVIIRGGFKVNLATVEAALVEHPAVTAACAVGLPDARLGEVPGAVVALAAGPEGPTDSELFEWLRARLPVYAVPTVIRVVDVIPQTPTFKPHRARVRELLDASAG